MTFELHVLGIIPEQVGVEHSFSKVITLLNVAAKDPSSPLAAAVAGWQFPVSREWMVQADNYDLLGKLKLGKKWRPSNNYPRPWTVSKTRIGRTGLPKEKVIALLDQARLGKLRFVPEH